MNRSLLLAIACLTVLTALTTSASAQVTCWPYPINNPTTQRCSGPVQGTVTYYEHQGNYCDTAGGHSCADTTFVVADHLALRPLKSPNPTPSPSWVNGPNGGWNRDTPEHYSSGFEEAYATFLGDRANYRKTATQPLTCLLEELPCDNTDQWNQIKTSRGAYANCAPVERRMPISAMRYLRDAYDDTPNGDSTDVSFQGMIRTIRQFPNGTADRQDSEAGNDGFNADDFRYQLLQSEGVNSQSILDANCKPYI